MAKIPVIRLESKNTQLNFQFLCSSPISPGLAVILLVLWTLGYLCYSVQFWPWRKSNGLWQLKSADPIFAWSIALPLSVTDLMSIELKSWILSLMAVLSICGALTTLKFGQIVQWPSFVFWQGMAGLLTALCGN